MASSNLSPPPSPDIERLQAEIADLRARVAALENSTLRPERNDATLKSEREKAESQFGLTVVNRVGAVTLIIGIIFFFKYAADNQWIGASSAIVLGMLAGLVLVVIGERLRLRGQQAFAQGIAGCGFAILYVSVYAAFGYYRIVSREAGFAGMLAVSALAILVSLRFASSAIAAVGFIGAFVAPLLTRHATHPWFYFAYLLLISFVSVAVSGRLYRREGQKSALFLAPFNTAWLLLCAWLLIEDQHPVHFILFTLVFSAVHFGAARLARSAPALFGVLYIAGHACILVAGLRAAAFWTSELDSVLLGIYGVFVIAYGVLQRSPINRALGLALLGIVVVKLYFYDVWLMNSFYRISAFVALGILLLAASYVYSRFKQRRA